MAPATPWLRMAFALAAASLVIYAHGEEPPAVLAPSVSQFVVSSAAGHDAPDCGPSRSPCQSIQYAVDLAPPHSVISVANGSYACGIHVTVPLSFEALGRGVFLRCAGLRRGMWFDGVPAAVDGLHFVDGYGEGAGGIVVSQYMEHPATHSSITRCTFTGCVGVASPVLRGVAGAVLITYEVSSLPRAVSITHSTFDHNYARGDVRPAGAVGLWVPGDVFDPRSSDVCGIIAVDFENHDGIETSAFAFAGVYRLVGPLEMAGLPASRDHPTYNTLGRAPTDDDESVRWILYCAETMLYGFTETFGAAPPNACDVNVTGASAMEGSRLFEYEWWLVRGGPRVLLVPRCQDAYVTSTECDHFYAHHVPATQIGRQAVFRRVPNAQHAERPVFAAHDGAESHFVWYCASASEWIFTDVGPPQSEEEACRRGITSGHTHVFHPVAAGGWKYWSDAADRWLDAPSPRHGGMHLVCTRPNDTPCRSFGLLNAPTDRVWRFNAVRDAGSLVEFESRPVYESRMQPPRYMCYCRKFSEWMIIEENPTTQPEDAAACERIYASLRSTAPTPDLVGSWAIGRTTDWEFSSVDVRCESGCHDLHLHQVNAPPQRECAFCGDYASAGHFAGGHYFRQRSAPHHLLYRPSDAEPWAVTLVASLHDAAAAATAVVLRAGRPADDVLLSEGWRAVGPFASGSGVDGSARFQLTCLASQNCSAVRLEHDGHPIFSTEYWRTTVAVNRRPTYRARNGATIEYTKALPGWIAWHPKTKVKLATAPTGSMVPTTGARWDAVLSASGVLSALATRAVVRCVGDAPTRARSGDVVSETHFSHNAATVELQDGQPSAGALLIHHGRAATGTVVRAVLRNNTFARNEATAPFRPAAAADAGGAVVLRGTSAGHLFATVSESTFTGNLGDAGGAVSVEAAVVTLHRVSFKQNFATVKGGAVAARSAVVNGTHFVCAHNHARTHGGCVWMASATRLTLRGGDLHNNTASVSGGVVASQGFVHVLQSKVERMAGMAMSGSVLMLVESQLNCGVGRAMTFVGGFGCIHDPAPTLPVGTTTPVVPIDATEAWWIWVANASSMLAQGMLSLTMAVFALQYCMAHHLANVMPTARQLQASRWRANQRQLQQQQQHEDRKRR